MRFAIDVLFVARTGEILRIDRSVPPWRTAIAWRAHAVVELAAGSVSTVDARAGDELELVAMSADEASPRL